jgi:tetratricopeptide (TPR) repeat protein
MVKKQKTTSSPLFPTEPFAYLPKETVKLTPEEIDAKIEAALKDEDPERALKVMEAAPRWMTRDSGFMLSRATVLFMVGEESQALKLMHEIERKDPKFYPVYTSLTYLYYEFKWPASALKAAGQALAHSGAMEAEALEEVETIEKNARGIIQKMADENAVGFDIMQRASLFNEQAQLALKEDRLSEVDRLCRETIKMIPTWNAPHNNRAHALYFSGRMAEAISVLEGVLERDPNNVFALSNLILFQVGLDQTDIAREYTARLVSLFDSIPPDELMIEKAVSMLALMEETSFMTGLIDRFRKIKTETLMPRTWHNLAVAAVRSDRWKDAIKILKKITADEDELPQSAKLLDELKSASKAEHPRLEWMPPAYFGADLLFHPKVMAEWELLLQTFSEPLTPSQRYKFNAFFNRYPFMAAAMKRMLWDQESFLVVLPVLADMERTDIDEEILRFAMSQTGTISDRIEAINELFAAGRYHGPKVLRLWDEQIGAWRDVELKLQKIGFVEPTDRPEVIKLLEKAAFAKKTGQAIELLREAVNKDPESAAAVFNLGVVLAQNGQEEEGERLIYRSVEIDPGYIFGHAAIALNEARNGNEKDALGHLDVVSAAEVIHPETAVLAQAAWAYLAVKKGDMNTAQRHFEIALKLNSDHPLLQSLKQMFMLKDEM